MVDDEKVKFCVECKHYILLHRKTMTAAKCGAVLDVVNGSPIDCFDAREGNYNISSVAGRCHPDAQLWEPVEDND